MKIALISSCAIETPPKDLSYGGLEKVVWLQALALAKLGFEVTVFTCEESRPIYVDGYGLYNVVTYCRKSTNVFEELNILREKYLNMLNEFDVVIDHSWLKTILINEMFRHRAIGIHHSLYPPEYVVVNPRIYGVSKTHAELIKKYLGVEAGYIYNCVDVWNYEFCEDKEDYVLYLGRWCREKGILNVLKFAKKYPDVKVVITGSLFLAESDVVSEVLKIASNLSNVELRPDVTHREKVELLKKAKAVIFAPDENYVEVFGLWCVESLLCGTPVVTYPSGAVIELIEDGKHGFIVKNLDEMYEKIKYEVENLNPRELRRRGEEFEPVKIVEKFLIPELKKIVNS